MRNVRSIVTAVLILICISSSTHFRHCISSCVVLFRSLSRVRRIKSSIISNKQSAKFETAEKMATTNSVWLQKQVTLSQRSRGCHLVTNEVTSAIRKELSQIEVGICHIFIQHTSASLTISENADPDVLVDMETHLDRIVPDVGKPGCPVIRHTEEGPDDMASHVKSSLTSTMLSVPISHGRLAFGTWQGIWLLEHRFYGGPRRLLVTMNGSTK